MASPTSRRSRRGPRPGIVVVGSINMDLVIQVPRLPKPGETIAGSDFRTLPGGKGANQAVAIARLGGHCTLIGCVGDDAFGAQLLEGLRAEGVNTRHVSVVPRCRSGVAVIGVEDSGQNSIALAPGANRRLRPTHLQALEPIVAAADLVLMQLEVPIATAAAALKIALRHEVPTVVDAAPVPPGGLPEAFREVDILSPNQTEASQLTGLPCATPAHAVQAAESLIQRYDAGLVVVKMGEHGAVAHAGTGAPILMPAYPVEAVDTTAAGDAFTAALALRLAEGAVLGDAMRFACAAGAVSATRLGAQASMPTRAQVERLLRQHGCSNPSAS